mmetsp:Transcript_46991/g.111924  ORF Transcript_46991/g.111924 Transcript_46991/m.111924 type:complete len:232 (-) Transcript_46991:76-771(-)
MPRNSLQAPETERQESEGGGRLLGAGERNVWRHAYEVGGRAKGALRRLVARGQQLDPETRHRGGTRRAGSAEGEHAAARRRARADAQMRGKRHSSAHRLRGIHPGDHGVCAAARPRPRGIAPPVHPRKPHGLRLGRDARGVRGAGGAREKQALLVQPHRGLLRQASRSGPRPPAHPRRFAGRCGGDDARAARGRGRGAQDRIREQGRRGYPAVSLSVRRGADRRSVLRVCR